MKFQYAVLILSTPLLFQAPATELTEAKQLYLKADFPAAIQKYLSIVEKVPGSEEAHVGLIRSRWKADEIEGAYISAKKALGAFPSSAPVHAALGDVLFRMAKMPEARDAYRKAIDLDPNSARGYFGLSKLLFFNSCRKTARGMEIKAYECDPEDPEIIAAYASELPAAEQILLLEKYLRLASSESLKKREAVETQIACLRKRGDLKTWVLSNAPKQVEIKLDSVYSPLLGETGYQISVLLNGAKKVKLQFDTGADGILIHRKLVKELNLETVSTDHIWGVGDSGPRHANIAIAESVKVGALEFRNCPLTVTEKSLLANTDGIIGAEVFKRFLLKLNLPRKKLELNQLPPIGGTPFDDPESWKNLDRTVPPELASFTPIGNYDHLVIPTGVNRKKTGFFILDTGAAVNVVSRELAKQVADLHAIGRVLQGISGASQTYLAPNVSLQLGRLNQKSDQIYVMDMKEMSRDLGVEISGLLGYPLLRHLSITIDYRDGLIEFEYAR
jgi:tetratricopeptide (TPR) repeat protein